MPCSIFAPLRPCVAACCWPREEEGAGLFFWLPAKKIMNIQIYIIGHLSKIQAKLTRCCFLSRFACATARSTRRSPSRRLFSHFEFDSDNNYWCKRLVEGSLYCFMPRRPHVTYLQYKGPTGPDDLQCFKKNCKATEYRRKQFNKTGSA